MNIIYREEAAHLAVEIEGHEAFRIRGSEEDIDKDKVESMACDCFYRGDMLEPHYIPPIYGKESFK